MGYQSPRGMRRLPTQEVNWCKVSEPAWESRASLQGMLQALQQGLGA